MEEKISTLVRDAERQILDETWDLVPRDRTLAIEVLAGLHRAVAVEVQELLPDKDRLERLREAIALLAVTVARTHGPLAWFLAGAIAALEPVLSWRALPAGPGQAFGTHLPAPEEYAQAENALRRLQDSLAFLTAG